MNVADANCLRRLDQLLSYTMNEEFDLNCFNADKNEHKSILLGLESKAPTLQASGLYKLKKIKVVTVINFFMFMDALYSQGCFTANLTEY